MPGVAERVGAAPWMGGVFGTVVVLVVIVVLYTGRGTPVATAVVFLMMAGTAEGLETVSKFLV